VVVLAVATVVRAATEPLPKPAITLLAPTVATVPGVSNLAWPAHGEAALTTPGGRLLGHSGPAKPVPIASIAKVMTAYLILRDHPLAPGQEGPEVVVTAAEAATLPARTAEGQSLLGVHAGEELSELQALQALLLPSADNIASILAVFDSGSEAAFVAKMNATARGLGMDSTHFADASGYDPATVSDPTDLLGLGRAAMAIPAFAAIVDERSATIPGVATVRNYNALVGTDGFTGIKTGSTGAAGQGLLFSVDHRVGGSALPIIGVVLAQHGPGVVTGALAAARRLADSVYAELRPRTVLAAGSTLAQVAGPGGSAAVKTARPLAVASLPGDRVGVTVAVSHPAYGRPTTVEVTVRGPFTVARQPDTGPPLRPPGWAWRLGHLFG
jgi:D-alanyl-D-alanine carboxypeptidase (penicillin-binding protein 5/6)